jgi:hypothetical protein
MLSLRHVVLGIGSHAVSLGGCLRSIVGIIVPQS